MPNVQRTRRKPTNEKVAAVTGATPRFAMILPAVAVLIGAIVGAGGSIYGSYISVAQQADITRTERLHTQRETVYQELLVTSNAFANASSDLEAFVQQGHTIAEAQANYSLINEFRNTRFDLRRAFGHVPPGGVIHRHRAGQLI